MLWVIWSNSDQLVYSKPELREHLKRIPVQSVLFVDTQELSSAISLLNSTISAFFFLNLLNFVFSGKKFLVKISLQKKLYRFYHRRKSYQQIFTKTNRKKSPNLRCWVIRNNLGHNIFYSGHLSKVAIWIYGNSRENFANWAQVWEENYQKMNKLKHPLGFGFFTWSSIKIRLFFFFSGKKPWTFPHRLLMLKCSAFGCGFDGLGLRIAYHV